MAILTTSSGVGANLLRRKIDEAATLSAHVAELHSMIAILEGQIARERPPHHASIPMRSGPGTGQTERECLAAALDMRLRADALDVGRANLIKLAVHWEHMAEEASWLEGPSPASGETSS